MNAKDLVTEIVVSINNDKFSEWKTTRQIEHKPKEWIFGHFHSYHQKQVGDTNFTCIGCVDSMGGHEFTIPFIIDTEKKTFEAFPKDTLMNSKGFHKTRILEKNGYPI